METNCLFYLRLRSVSVCESFIVFIHCVLMFYRPGLSQLGTCLVTMASAVLVRVIRGGERQAGVAGE